MTSTITKIKGKAPEARDMFAEMYVAGMFANAGWELYFPRHDRRFDFVAVKEIKGSILTRPVHIKGLYPQDLKKPSKRYGFTGKLKLHPDAVLAIAYFDRALLMAPDCVVFLPETEIERGEKLRCHPANYNGRVVTPRQDFARYFGLAGLALLESESC